MPANTMLCDEVVVGATVMSDHVSAVPNCYDEVVCVVMSVRILSGLCNAVGLREPGTKVRREGWLALGW